jgi:aminomethyltransferase
MSDAEERLKTVLHGKHVSAGATMGRQDGWEVPLDYGDAAAECGCVRSSAGIFDISHIGRVRIRGGGALDLLERLCTADVAHQEDNTAMLTCLCNEQGGILDACFLLRLEDYWLLTTSAGRRVAILEHVNAVAGDLDVKVTDVTAASMHVAISGPAAAETLDKVLPFRISDLSWRAVQSDSYMVARYIAVRAGYTGEWSVEVILPRMVAGLAWDFITKKAGQNAIAPMGMAARETLRIEAGLRRYGRELSEAADPITAGLGASVDLEHDFIGKAAVAAVRDTGPDRKLVGLFLPSGREGPETGARVTDDGGRDVGVVTSAAVSATLGKTIAMAYVDADSAGTQLGVQCAADTCAAEVGGLPFYRPCKR